MNIRPTKFEDLHDLISIYEYARKFMQKHGNPYQWVDGYPSEDRIRKDIDEGCSYVCEDEKGEIVAAFCFSLGEDATYAKIEKGAWLNDEPYAVIHRMASNGKKKGIAAKCIEWCFIQHSNIRVDTHSDNTIMQNILKENGFVECGIIHVHDGTPRIAYQKCI